MELIRWYLCPFVVNASGRRALDTRVSVPVSVKHIFPINENWCLIRVRATAAVHAAMTANGSPLHRLTLNATVASLPAAARTIIRSRVSAPNADNLATVTDRLIGNIRPGFTRANLRRVVRVGGTVVADEFQLTED